MIIKKFPKGLDVKGVADFLLNNYPITSIAETAADLLLKEYRTEKITLTRQQFLDHFRITGIRPDGGAETRGRKPKED